VGRQKRGPGGVTEEGIEMRTKCSVAMCRGQGLWVNRKSKQQVDMRQRAVHYTRPGEFPQPIMPRWEERGKKGKPKEGHLNESREECKIRG